LCQGGDGKCSYGGASCTGGRNGKWLRDSYMCITNISNTQQHIMTCNQCHVSYNTRFLKKNSCVCVHMFALGGITSQAVESAFNHCLPISELASIQLDYWISRYHPALVMCVGGIRRWVEFYLIHSDPRVWPLTERPVAFQLGVCVGGIRRWVEFYLIYSIRVFGPLAEQPVIFQLGFNLITCHPYIYSCLVCRQRATQLVCSPWLNNNSLSSHCHP
jgi:hypothetical protein